MDLDSLPRLLKYCATAACARGGAALHARAVKGGFAASTSTANSIVSLYAKCGMLESSWRVFRAMAFRDSVSWNAMVHGFLSGGESEKGLALFADARAAGYEPNVGNIVLALQACWRVEAAIEVLSVIHGLIAKTGASGHLPVQNSLLTCYAKSGDVGSARQLFDEIPRRDVISWSALIGGCAQWGKPEAALRCFQEMTSSDDGTGGFEPDGLSLVSVLQACSRLEDAGRAGQMIHAQAVRRGISRQDVFFGNTLIDMYSKCRDLGSARRAFAELPIKNLVSWNSLLSGLVHSERHSEALSLYDSMSRAGVEGDEVTLVNLLQTCRSSPQGGARCRSIHGVATRRCLHHSNLVVVNTILEAYCKCGLAGLAFRLFGTMAEKNLISWSTMMMGFSGCGLPEESVSLFRDMALSGVRPNSVVMLSLVQACSTLAEVTILRSIHAVALRNGLAGEFVVGTALLDAYAKCGEIDSSDKVFRCLSVKNVVSWSAMICAHGVNGRAGEALSLFREMESQGVQPNEVTVLSLLSACSHGGLVEEGLSLFSEAFAKSSLTPSPEHYSCLVDMLARAGDVSGGLRVIEELPARVAVGGGAWGSLLSACRSYGDCELGERALSSLAELEDGSAGYLLASNMYAMDGLKEDSARMRMIVKAKGLRVAPGFSSVSVDRKLHRFVAGEESHPRTEEIRLTLRHLHHSMSSPNRPLLPMEARRDSAAEPIGAVRPHRPLSLSASIPS